MRFGNGRDGLNGGPGERAAVTCSRLEQKQCSFPCNWTRGLAYSQECLPDAQAKGASQSCQGDIKKDLIIILSILRNINRILTPLPLQPVEASRLRQQKTRLNQFIHSELHPSWTYCQECIGICPVGSASWDFSQINDQKLNTIKRQECHLET